MRALLLDEQQLPDRHSDEPFRTVKKITRDRVVDKTKECYNLSRLKTVCLGSSMVEQLTLNLKQAFFSFYPNH